MVLIDECCCRCSHATLVGDPPNIVIGSKMGITFTECIMYDARRL